MIRGIRPMLFAAVVAAGLSIARPALAGPPLLCFPFDIGAAKSLPMGRGNWHAIDRSYDVSRLVGDTLALLTPETPTLVRMETIRRAVIYAAGHPELAETLLARLRERATIPVATAGAAVFDFGYLVETFRQAEPVFKRKVAGISGIDGYALVKKARALQDDPIMDHAAHLIAGTKTTQP
jgi:hypothetical protein